MDDTEFMFAEEIAAAAGIELRTVYVAQTNARAARRRLQVLTEAGMDPAEAATEADVGPWLLPESADRVHRTRPVQGGGHARTVDSPRWRRSEVEVWLRARRGPGGRPVSEQAPDPKAARAARARDRRAKAKQVAS